MPSHVIIILKEYSIS